MLIFASSEDNKTDYTRYIQAKSKLLKTKYASQQDVMSVTNKKER